MTSQKDQIQSLIDDIERALSAQRSKKPWVRASDVEPQREALAKAQDYLRSLQQSFDAPGGWGPVDPSTGQIAAERSERVPTLPTFGASLSGEGAFGQASDESGQAASQTAENVLQALLTEMKYLKSSALEPLRLEMDELRSKRDQLQAEVQALDEQRASVGSELSTLGGDRNTVSEEQLNDFLTALMGRLQENLTTQVGQTLEQLESDHAAAISKLAADDEAVLQLRSSGQIEELRQLQGRSDQLLVNIDSTLQRMFETLQQNINSYQLSLNEGLENMHSLGRQGEVIVRSLVDHLTAQLGQSSLSEPAFFPARSAAPLSLADEDSLLPEDTDALDDDSSNDTVSSLNEVLPDFAAPKVESSDLEAASDSTLAAAVTEAAENSDADAGQAVAPEDCIREDGTIDLDLLKLDIDRDEAAAIAPDDVMVDAAIADAQVAATESEDTEIEAKVLPTAESLYLADLTLDDLTVDPELPLVDDSSDSTESSEISDEAEASHDVDSSEAAASEQGSELETVAIVETDSAALVETADASELAAAELAAVLPDLSAPELPEDESFEGDTASATNLEAYAPEDAGDAGGSAELPSEDPESALVPDIPDSDDEIIERMPLPGEDDTLSPDLVEELDGVSRDAERVAAESDELDVDALASDLEEAVVFDEDVPGAKTAEPAQLSESADGLDSALIPDRPEEAAHEASLQASLEEVTAPVGESRLENAPISPTDFDDDLDFYPETSAPIAEEVADNENLDAIQDPAESTVAATTAAEPSIAEPAIEETPAPLLEPPLAAVPASAPPLADPVDPFTTAELDPSLDESQAGSGTSDAVASDSLEPIAADLPPEVAGDTSAEEGQWFLGVDIGTTGLSAVLINQLGEQVYPLCWEADSEEGPRFRLPAVAQMIGKEMTQPGFGEKIGEVGVAALQSENNGLLRHLKPLLKVGIPHGISGEPWVQWSEEVALPLQELQSALSELLRSLSAQRASCHAIGLSDAVLRRVLANLSGVVVGYPTNWPDTYSFNVREAVLAAGLVSRGEQVFFVEEAIAALLSALPDPNMDPVDLDDQQPGLYNCLWSGGTVVLSAGATLTEAAIADLPADLEQLSYRDFALRSFGYAGDSLDQDIICQLLHPGASRSSSEASESSVDAGWSSLGLDNLDLPQPGEVDRFKRYRLRQRLQAFALGREAIAAAQKLKVDLQEASQSDIRLGDRTWTINRKDLETKVFLPYIQRVNRHVNALLSQAEMSSESVKQVICTGGSASLSAIARWLRQKFPNATIIQDTYNGEYSNSCSRVAYGLANICHYPNVIDSNRHQYSDYFLLMELLRILPDQPLPAGGILHLLEQRGIDTQACQLHILALIEGHLPPGLVPIESDRPLISAQSPDIPTYEAISELPLFRKQGGQIYIADAEQGERLRQHLEAVLSGKAQTLDQPQSLQLAAETVQ